MNQYENRRKSFNCAKIAAVLVIGLIMGISIITLSKVESITYTSKAP